MKFLAMILAFIFAMNSLTVGPTQEDEFRTWTSSNGEFSVEAKLTVQARDPLRGEVILTKDNGKEITVDYDKLDAECQQVVLDARRAARREARSKKPERKRKKGSSASKEVESDSMEPASIASTWNWRGPNRDGISGRDWAIAEVARIWASPRLDRRWIGRWNEQRCYWRRQTVYSRPP